MVAWGGQPFGAAVGSALAEALGVRPGLLIVALGVGVSAVLGWFSPLRDRTLQGSPEPAPDAGL